MADRGRGLRRRRRHRPGGQAGHELGGHQHVRSVRDCHAVHYQMGRCQDQVRRRFLYGRWRHHRVPEWIGDRRRLHVRRLVPRNLGCRDGHRLRWPHLFHRISGRLADHHFSDGRTTAQPGQVHLCRRRRLSLSADADPYLCGIRHAGRRRVLPDCPDGGRGRADQIAVRPRILDRGRHRRRSDDGVRPFRRDDRHDVGADHQGLHAAVRRNLHGHHGAGAVRFQSRGSVRKRRRS